MASFMKLLLFAQIHEKTNFENRRKTDTPWMLIDSMTLPLNLMNHRWAEFRKTKSGVKLHLRLVFMEKGLSYPDKALTTNEIEHDRDQLDVFVDDQECMYVFHRIKVLDDKGKELMLISNRFDISAVEIANIYKSRWAIELFFKWMKQHLSIKKWVFTTFI